MIHDGIPPRRKLGVAALLLVAMTSGGCTLCQNCGDADYPTYGGAWQRTRRDGGRVGSIFDPAGVRTATLTDRDLNATKTPARDANDVTGSAISAEEKQQEKAEQDKQKSKGDGDEAETSPSDRPNSNSLRDLNLDDINFPGRDLEPPEA